MPNCTNNGATSNRSYLSFAESGHPYETFVVIYWHYARNNGTSNTNLTAVIHKLEKDVGIIEKLCDNKVSASINLQRKLYNEREAFRNNNMIDKTSKCYHLQHYTFVFYIFSYS
jgi:hypothetical protein